MPTPIHISTAASLGIHAMAILALNDPRPRTVQILAKELQSSEAHLAKVFQRLVKMNLVTSSRGRSGGYRLARPATDINLLDIYEAIEGPYRIEECLFNSPICHNTPCLFGEFLREYNSKLKVRLSETSLAELRGSMRIVRENASSSHLSR